MGTLFREEGLAGLTKQLNVSLSLIPYPLSPNLQPHSPNFSLYARSFPFTRQSWQKP